MAWFQAAMAAAQSRKGGGGGSMIAHDASSGDLFSAVNVEGITGSPLRPRTWVDDAPAWVVAVAAGLAVVWLWRKGK